MSAPQMRPVERRELIHLPPVNFSTTNSLKTISLIPSTIDKNEALSSARWDRLDSLLWRCCFAISSNDHETSAALETMRYHVHAAVPSLLPGLR